MNGGRQHSTRNGAACLSARLVALAVAMAAPTATWAQGVKAGPYIGLQYGHNQMGGELDDTLVLTGPGEVIDVPRVKAGGGAGIVWGFRTAGGGGGEIGWHQSRHRTTSILLGESRASLSVLDFDARYGLYNKDPMRAWVLFGFALQRMTIERSRVTNTARTDATYNGYGFNLGVGGAVHPTDAFGVTLDIFWRRRTFTSVQGTSIDGDLDGSGPALRLGVVWSY